MGTGANTQADGRSKPRPGVAEQKSNIVDAAVELFAERGVSAVSVAKLCAAADISRPTFYRCFEDKHALVTHIYAIAVNAHVEGLLLSGDLRDPAGLRASLDDMLSAIFANATLARLVFAESADPASPAARIVDRAFEQAADVLSRDLAAAGQTPPSRVYLKSLMAAVQWIVHDAIRKGLDERTRREASSAAFELITRALARGPGDDQEVTSPMAGKSI